MSSPRIACIVRLPLEKLAACTALPRNGGYFSNHPLAAGRSRISVGEGYLAARDKLWIVLLASLVAAQTAVSLLIRQSQTLTIVSDLLQGTLLLIATAAFIPNILRPQPISRRTRLFWILMSVGMLFWLAYQAMWNYFEVIRRQDVPAVFAGDIVLFLHLVPMIAALALRPHLRQEERNARIGMVDFALLMTWWVFLYVYAVIPWQYVHASEASYSNNFNLLYLTEKLVLLFALALLSYRSRGGWRQLYGQLLGASALYASSSYVANWAIGHKTYYSGSIYDIPLTVSIAWIALPGKFASRYPLAESEEDSDPMLGVWVTRFGMLAVFSLPWLALHSQFDSASSLVVNKFRVALSLLTLLVMGGMVFWRQSLLGVELSHLLESSRRSFQDLQALQRQLIQSEKLASLGRLVGGAAHEINNPLTAMLGYSDLLSSSDLRPQEQRLAARISEQVSRTRTLVASLLTFANQAPARMSLVDLNSVVHTALRLVPLQRETQSIATQVELGSSLPPVLADSNQLLHVTLHLAGQTLNRLNFAADSTLYVQTRSDGNTVVLELSDGPLATENPSWIPLETDRGNNSTTLSLSACRRLVKEHGGRILSKTSPDGPSAFRLELPAAAKGGSQTSSRGDVAGIGAAATSNS